MQSMMPKITAPHGSSARMTAGQPRSSANNPIAM